MGDIIGDQVNVNNSYDVNASQVLIVGAGPSGLMAALLLAIYGIGFRIIERERIRETTGLSESIQPRVLEVLESLGIREDVERRGLKVCEYAVYERLSNGNLERKRTGREVASPASYEYSIIIDKGVIEEILEVRLRQLGHRVQRGVELLDIVHPRDTGQQGACCKSHASGKIERFHAPYILGCDGPSQLTRRLSHIRSEDYAVNTWLIVDLVATTHFPDSRRRCTFRLQDGDFALVPLKDGIIRSRTMVSREQLHSSNKQHKLRSDRNESNETKISEFSHDIDGITLSMVNGMKQAMHPFVLDVQNIHWQRMYSVQRTLARSFHNQGLTVFLLGSACHVQSPLTRQGINRGMMDAWNFSWKLAMYLKGLAKPCILKSFDLERRTTLLRAMEFESQVDSVFSGTMGTSDELAGLHDFEAATPYTSGCGLRYAENCLIKEEVRTYIRDVPYPIMPGKRLPPARLIRHMDGSEEHVWTFMPASLKFKLILFLGQIVNSPIVQGLCGYLNSTKSPLSANAIANGNKKESLLDLWVIHTLSHLEMQIMELPQPFLRYQNNIFEDHSGTWHNNLGISPKLGCLCIVRPDGYVGLVTNLDNCNVVNSYLDETFL